MALKVLTIKTDILYDEHNYYDAPQELWDAASDIILEGLADWLGDFEFGVIRNISEADLRDYVEGEFEEDGWTTEDYEAWKAQKYMDEVVNQEYDDYLNPEIEGN